jgi:hypothetical protein
MSDGVLGQVKELLAQLTPAEKAEVVAWLGAALKAEWLEQGALSDDIAPLLPDTQYHVYTPLGGEDTAQALLDFLKAEEGKTKKDA